MIRALAIETSGRIGSVALARDGQVLSQETFEHGLQHAAHIIPAIDELCRQGGWKPADIQEIYVSAGPGSFTGLRIGITLAKTIAFATEAKIVAVPSVRVLVENAPDDAERVIIVLDAKRDQIFTAAFERHSSPSPGTPGEGRGGGSEVSEDESANQTKPPPSPSPEVPGEGTKGEWSQQIEAHLGTLTEMLARVARPVHLVGEGIPYHEKFIPRDDAGVIVTDPAKWRAKAEAVTKIGWAMGRAGEFVDAMKLVPVYIRRPEAEEKYVAG